MPHLKFVSLEQGSPEWLAFRTEGLGASEFPSVYGTPDAYSDQESLIQAKLGLKIVELSEYSKEIFAQGHEIEGIVRESLNQEGFSFKPAVCVYPKNERLFASLDGLDMDREQILEVKSTSSKKIIEQIEQGMIPAVYYAQIQFQLFVTGLSGATLVVVNKTNNERHRFSVAPDQQLLSSIERIGVAFLTELDKRRTDLTQISSDSDVSRLEEVVAVIKDLEAKLKILEDEKKFLADLVLRRYNAYTVSSPRITVEYCQRQGNVDYKAIPELAGVDLEKYRKKPSEYIKVTIAKGN